MSREQYPPSPYLAKGKQPRNNRNRARRILSIQKHHRAKAWIIWGGEDVHVVELIDGIPACDCRAFTTVNEYQTTYCSHVAKYDIAIRNKEPEREQS